MVVELGYPLTLVTLLIVLYVTGWWQKMTGVVVTVMTLQPLAVIPPHYVPTKDTQRISFGLVDDSFYRGTFLCGRLHRRWHLQRLESYVVVS